MAYEWVVIDEIKQKVSLQMIFDHYDLSGKRKGKEVRLHCPFHDDEHPSLSANVTKGAWQCFGCGLKGDGITFVACMEGIDTGSRNQDRREAALYLARAFGIESARPESPVETHAPHAGRGKRPRPRTRARTEPSSETMQTQGDGATAEAGEPAPAATDAPSTGDTSPVNPPLSFTFTKLDTRHAYLIKERALTPETIDHFGLGFHAGKGIMAGRVVIPIHNETGELVAYAGRWPGEPPEGEPKYKFPPNFHKSLVLFNFHRAREHAGEGLIVVEGFFTIFDLWQKGRKNVVAIMGSSLSAEQGRLIVETVGAKGRVLIAFDADEAGRKGSKDAVARLATEVFVRSVELA